MTDDFFEPANCACFNVRRAARQITQAYDRALKPAGIQATQFTLLAMLDSADDGDGIAMSHLAGRLGMDRTTLTRNLAPVEKAGWVNVTTGDDRRERRVALTTSGRQTVRAALTHWRTAQARIVEQLGDAGLAGLLTVTRQLDTR